jgi:hypothetical protein
VVNNEAIVPTLIFAFFFLWGVRSSWWLTSTYRAVAPLILPNRRAIGLAFVVIAWAVTVVAGWLGFTSLRRLLGMDPLDWGPFIGYVLALPVLTIPAYLKRTWMRIGATEGATDALGRIEKLLRRNNAVTEEANAKLDDARRIGEVVDHTAQQVDEIHDATLPRDLTP